MLVDTRVWIDHIRAAGPLLTALLATGNVLVHPFVIGEIAVGNLRDREIVIRRLQDLTHSTTASNDEVLEFIGWHRLHRLGIGYVDCHLRAAITLTPGARLWTQDIRLSRVASRLGLAASGSDGLGGAEPSSWSTA
jgi:hypothetical protein